MAAVDSGIGEVGQYDWHIGNVLKGHEIFLSPERRSF